jgi:hypothetical protein
MFWYFADLVHDSILLSVAMLDVYLTQPLVGAPGASCTQSSTFTVVVSMVELNVAIRRLLGEGDKRGNVH